MGKTRVSTRCRGPIASTRTCGRSRRRRFQRRAAAAALDSEILYEDDSVCVVARRSHRGKRSFTLAEYIDMAHVVVDV